MSLRVLIAIALAGTGLVWPGAPAGQEPSPRAVDDPEAYRVYASILSTEWAFWAAKSKVLVIQQETTTWDCMSPGKLLFIVSGGVVRQPTPNELLVGRFSDRYAIWKPLFDAHRAANQTVRALLPGQELGVPYKLVTAREIAMGHASGGYIQASAVGFDAAGTRAMVHTEYRCGGLCGGGHLHVLEKVNGDWREAAKLCRWRA